MDDTICLNTSRTDSSLTKAFLYALCLSFLAVILVAIPNLIGAHVMYSINASIGLGICYFLMLIIPLTFAFQHFFRERNLLHPTFVASLTFAVFHVAFSPLTYCNVLEMAHVRLDEQNPAYEIFLTYLVLLTAWFGLLCGQFIVKLFGQTKNRKHRANFPITSWYLVLGLAFIAIGVLGNIGIIGGVANYLAKMRYFYASSDAAREIMYSGATKYRIAQGFLPVGIVLIIYGRVIRHPTSRLKLFGMFFFGTVTNLMLACSTGGRGKMLLVAFYAIVLWNHSLATQILPSTLMNRITPRQLRRVVGILITVAYILGIARGSHHYGTEARIFDSRKISRMVTHYLSNYNGTLRSVCEVETSGIVNGMTAFAGVQGLLGGATPRRTEDELRDRWTITTEGLNARYGPPADLYFNFGWTGLFLGSMFFGIILGCLSKLHEHALALPTASAGLLAVFTSFNANFLMLGNLSSFPAHFVYYSLPFYLVFFLMNRVRC